MSRCRKRNVIYRYYESRLCHDMVYRILGQVIEVTYRGTNIWRQAFYVASPMELTKRVLDGTAFRIKESEL